MSGATGEWLVDEFGLNVIGSRPCGRGGTELTNASPRTAGYEWLDELPSKDMVFCESLYLWASYADLDEEDNLAEDLREAARRIGELILARSIDRDPLKGTWMGHPKRYVDFTSTGIHVDIERYLDTPEGKEALDRIDQAGKSLNRKVKKINKPYVIWHKYKDNHWMNRLSAKKRGWAVWGKYARLSDAEHTLDKLTREYGSFMDLKLESNQPATSTETP